MLHNLKPYPAYKDSGVPWLGEVPEHWEVLPNRALFEEVKERDYPEEQLLSVTISQGVIQQTDLLTNSSKKDSSNEDKTKYKLVKPGDIAYNKMRAWQGAIGVSRYRGIVSPAYVVVRPRGAQNPNYFHYLLRTPDFAKEAERWSYGITSDQWSLRHEHFKMVYCSLPPDDEQSAIVNYLDHIDRHIRHYIRAKQKLIKLLEEQKQAIIHQAVTRGLDPNVKLKPSGVDWLGDVPEHWNAPIKMKYISFLKGRLGWQGLKASEYTDHGPYVVSSAHFKGHRIKWGICPHVSQARYKMDENIQLSEGDILLMKDGAAMGKLAFIDHLPDAACLNSHLLVFRPLVTDSSKTYYPRFLFYFMLTNSFQNYVQVNGTGATFLGISQESIGNYKICLPPLEEQQEIAEFIDGEVATLNKALATVEDHIEFLSEYRTRLIADVVTGKLDVREAAANLPEETDEKESFDDALAEDEELENNEIENEQAGELEEEVLA